MHDSEGPIPEFFQHLSRTLSVASVQRAEFRRPTRGPNKGKLSIKIPGTQRKVRVTRAEMQEFA